MNHAEPEAQPPLRRRDNKPLRISAPGLRLPLLFGLGIVVLWLVSHVLLVLFAGILLASLLRGLANWLSHISRLSVTWSLSIVLIVILALIIAGSWWIAPQVIAQFDLLFQRIPPALDRTEEYLEQYEWGRALLNYLPDSALTAGADLGGRVADLVADTVVVIADLVVILFIGLYMAYSPRTYVNGFVRLFPVTRRDRARQILDTMGHTLQWWLVGRVFTMIIVGLLTLGALLLLRIPLAVPLAIITTILTFVPYVGPVLAGIPILAMAAAEGTTQLLSILLLYVAIQSAEGYVLTPLIENWAVKLPPAIVLAALALFGTLLGPLGLILATPLAAALMVLINMAYVQDVLGEQTEDRPSPG